MKKLTLFSFCISLILFTTVKAQIVFNNGFENWTGNVPNNWVGTQTTIEPDSILQYTTNVHSGSKACKIVNRESLTKNFSTSSFNIEAGETYFISFWQRGHGSISLNLYTGVNTPISEISGSDTNYLGWINRTAQFTATTNSSIAELAFVIRQTQAEYDDIQFDDILIYKTQTYQFLDTNNISAKICSDGSLFNNHFEVPKGTGINSIFASDICIGGKDVYEQLHFSFEKYLTDEREGFDFGPIANNYDDTNYLVKYNKVWKVNKSDILNHIANYSTGGYIVPASIANWPGNGNTANGEMAILAPYVDVNLNNIYDPINGDYPKIRGDQAVFFMFNDDKGSGDKMKIEVHGMAYSFAIQSDSALNQTVFVNYQVTNRSTYNYHDVYFGSRTDADLGYANDDYIGCDSALNMFYSYNGRDNDPLYGNNPPVQGVVLLSHSISKFMNPTPSSPNPATSNPNNAIEFYNYLKGIWKDNTPLVYGETGHISGGGNTPCSFMFSGKPELGNGWTEENCNNAPGDRTGMMSAGPFTLNSNEKLCFDIAFPFARFYDGGRLTSLVLLRQRAQAIQSFYNSQSYDCEMPSTEIAENNKIENIRVFPNPNNGTFYIITPNNSSNSTIEIYSVLGNKVYSKNIISEKTIIDLENSKGIFIYLVYNHKKEIVGKGKLILE